MYRFLFFYANMIVNKNEVLNKVKLKLKLKFDLPGVFRWDKTEYYCFLNWNERDADGMRDTQATLNGASELLKRDQEQPVP